MTACKLVWMGCDSVFVAPCALLGRCHNQDFLCNIILIKWTGLWDPALPSGEFGFLFVQAQFLSWFKLGIVCRLRSAVLYLSGFSVMEHVTTAYQTRKNSWSTCHVWKLTCSSQLSAGFSRLAFPTCVPVLLLWTEWDSETCKMSANPWPLQQLSGLSAFGLCGCFSSQLLVLRFK